MASTETSSTILQKSQSLELVTIEIVINVVIGGFSGEDLNWLAHVTVRLQVSELYCPITTLQIN